VRKGKKILNFKETVCKSKLMQTAWGIGEVNKYKGAATSYSHFSDVQLILFV